MKKLLLIFCMLINLAAYSQGNEREQELMKLVSKLDTIPRSVFLDTTLIKGMRLVNKSNWRNVWSDIDDDVKSIGQLYDIRISFKNNKKALEFHQEYLPENSEFGPEITNHGVNVEGVQELRVFNCPDWMYEMAFKAAGYKVLNFIFVVDNYAVKLYVTCIPEYEPTYFTPFIEDIVKRIKASEKK